MATASGQGQVARKYQEEIFRQAQKSNVIAYLRTGLGKTLISVLLMRWVCTQEKAAGKAIIFLVPKVSLVEQQAQYIHKETGLRTCRLHGALSLDFANREGWKKRFKDNDVFVVTPQLFLEMITHSIWAVDKCSLIIFDECHHARKNHPYNGIMREYFQVKDVATRPKIFGMTASPYWNQKNPALSLSTLEANLDSKIIGVHEHVEELQSHYAKFHEVVQTYPYPLQSYDFPEPTLFECLKTLYANDPAMFDHMDISWKKIEMRYYMTLNNLGPYCASLFLFTEIQHHMTGLQIRANRVLAAELQNDAMALDMDASFTQPSKLPPIGMFDVLEILDGFEPYFYSEDSPESLPVPVPLDWCTPKVRVLVDLIRAHLSTSTVQTIVFVEQRQTASCLAKVLEAIPELKDLVRCAHLVGQGTSSDGTSKQTAALKGDAIEQFRKKEINILIATSVAEEGLDFPACELVIRFDPLQHLVGYVQSRGRARSEVSKYVVMIQEDNVAQLERYKALQRGETELSQTYHTRNVISEEMGLEDDFDTMQQDTHPIDLAERERYVVPSTGAVLTYDNAMNLINHLCSIIPRDAFTNAPKPIYSGEYQSRMRLPAGLPLAPGDLTYIGYPKRTKKEAKRSVAFRAVRRLLRLNVFDEYLLPTSNHADDEDGPVVPSNNKKGQQQQLPPEIMEVDVKDPWCMAATLWLHPVALDSENVAGIVTGTSLPPIDMCNDGANVILLPGVPLTFDPEKEQDQRRLMEEFTHHGIWRMITAKPLQSKNLSLFLVPLNNEGFPDYDKMKDVLENRAGTSDWSGIKESDYGDVWVFNWHQYGRTYRLKNIRYDLTPQSVPPPGTKESGEANYYEYFKRCWTRKNREARVPLDGPLLEATILERSDSGAYNLQTTESKVKKSPKADIVYLLPRNCCRFLLFPKALSRAFALLPILCRAVTDMYRAQSARFVLRLPAIDDRLVTEALTIPSAMVDFNNQRLETLGDAVLQLCTTVHILNLYPNRHEGQLSDLRMKLVSNRYLLRRALDIGLYQFVSSEIASVGKWRYVIDEDGMESEKANRHVTIAYPRRSLQDCMEALLGASFWEGGIPMALQTGTSMMLEFGGSQPWVTRYFREAQDAPVTPLFDTLQEKLGYRFRSNDLLVEAVTHPSFATTGEGPSYQRLEFLGDAILDLVVVHYLYTKFPEATSHQLTFLRAKVICAPALAYLAVKKLGLHKIILVNNMELYRAIDMYVPVLEAISDEEIIQHGWKYDPPKAISDVFESVIGAVLVDTGYNYEKTAVITEDVMSGIIEGLNLSMALDPVSELVEWIAKKGCRQKIAFPKQSSPGAGLGISVEVHNTLIVGPIVASTLNVAKFLASERAFALLSDDSNQLALHKLCDCSQAMDSVDVVDSGIQETVAEPMIPEPLEDEKKENKSGGSASEEDSVGMELGDD